MRNGFRNERPLAIIGQGDGMVKLWGDAGILEALTGCPAAVERSQTQPFGGVTPARFAPGSIVRGRILVSFEARCVKCGGPVGRQDDKLDDLADELGTKRMCRRCIEAAYERLYQAVLTAPEQMLDGEDAREWGEGALSGFWNWMIVAAAALAGGAIVAALLERL